ncbi:phytoene/squalene synthase family protein [Aureimonas mangrovi]|uniref:phytoene/squalene synthase family protein n=1 Tax=Aureimonas mangrovi TaxID=2758041 RepID=UPI00163D41F6|nr:phytoene/squalene synthase family protein [Aureimonas mangrovi]
MSGSSEAKLDAAFAHCLEELRRADPDRAVALAFAPADAQGPLAALYAFDRETASVRDHVNQALPGEIRLQWWRDRLASDAVDPLAAGEGSPVAGAFMATMRRFDLPVAIAERLIDARIFDLYDDTMPDRTALEAYAGETASTILMLAAMILDRNAAQRCADIAGHAGVALTIATVLERGVTRPERAQAFVPDEIFEAAGVTRAQWAAEPSQDSPVTQALMALATEHHAKARRLWPALPRSVRPAFLPVTLVPARLQAAAGAIGSRPASPPRGVGPFRRSFLYWRALRARQTTA